MQITITFIGEPGTGKSHLMRLLEGLIDTGNKRWRYRLARWILKPTAWYSFRGNKISTVHQNVQATRSEHSLIIYLQD